MARKIEDLPPIRVTVGIEPWFRIALDALIAMKRMGYCIEDRDVQRLIREAVVVSPE